MYLNKISSGTILALLALSGILFLVPIAAPVHAAQNASQPTITLSNNLILGSPAAPNSVTITIANPSTNAYSVNQITVSTPAGWNFTNGGTVCPGAATLTQSASAISCGAVSGANALNILPGFSASIVITGSGTHAAPTGGLQGPHVAASASPTTGIFTTSVIDGGSSPAAYSGPSFTMWTIAAPVSIILGNSLSTYVAGSAPITITAQIGSNQPGVPIAWTSAAGTTAAGTFSSTSTNTGSTGAATVTFTPSNTAGTATVTATVQDAPAGLASAADTITTVANVPSKISFTLGGAFPATHYVTASVAIGGANYANIAGTTIGYSVSDSYANAIAGGNVAGLVGHFTATNGFFNGVVGTVTDPVVYGTVAGTVATQYSQSGVYGNVGLITGTFSGTYTPTSTAFSVSGSTGNIFTSTFGVPSITANPAATVGAGKTITLNVPLSIAQAGVPVTINLCVHSACAGTTKGYSGSFVTNSLQSIVVSTSTTAPSTGNASAKYTADTTLNHAGVFNATVPQPIDGTPTAKLSAGVTGAVSTTAGTAAQFKVSFELVANTGKTVSNIVSGGTGYVAVYTADKYGNVVVTGLSQQVQINLLATAGVLSVTSAYIPAGLYNTNASGSFGSISWTLPATIGTVGTLTVSGVLAGVATSTSISVTTVSPLPTLSVATPKPVSGVIYSQSSAVVFTGKANASIGYPSSVNIASIGYKVGAGTWQTATVTPANQITWSVAATAPAGLSTVTFNATDSKSNVVVSPIYTVLVDATPPVFAFSSATSTTGSLAVTVTAAEGDFNTTSFSATYGSTAIPSASISWSGTQTLGSSSVLTATINGLTTGTNTLTVTGKSLTGVSASNSESLTVTIPFANSISFTTASASYGTVGAYKGISVPVTNSWNTAQTIVVYATFKSGTGIYIAQGTTTLSPGQTASVFCIDLQPIPAGTYTVTFSAVTTSNAAVSAPTTAITVVAT